MPRYSKLQLQVLSLYKDFLKLSKEKPGIKNHIKREFKKNISIPKSDIHNIEYLLRRGRKQFNLLSSEDVTGMGNTVDK